MIELQDCARARTGEGRAPATALAAYSRGTRVGQGLAGRIDGEGTEPATTTAFRIASCTKSFTAAAVLLLRDRGALDLDDDVAGYLPELRVTGWGEEPGESVLTLRMLLSMSSGLPTDDPWADRQESTTKADFSQLLADGVRLVRQPGSGYEYSNLGYAMLGRVVEVVSGSPYREFVEQEILAPLGMAGTVFSRDEVLAGIDGGRSTATGVATGYRKNALIAAGLDSEWTELATSKPGAFSAIGGLFSTLDDLGRWGDWLAEAFAGDDEPGHGPLSRATRREMQTQHQIAGEPDTDGTVDGYGYGLVVQHHAVHGTVVGHSGGYPGFSSHMRWHPGQELVVVGFENATYSNVGIPVRELLEARLTREAGAAPATSASESPQPSKDQRPAGTPWPETLQAMEAVEALVRNAELTKDDEVFSTNVGLDKPWPERQAALDAALAVVGPLLEPERSEPGNLQAKWATPAAVEWELPARDGALTLRITMTPVHPPRVQLLEIGSRQ
ncbi:serine hydrolase [Arthrobacter sp. GMC3]|uniref:serine hydrolase domain-containing protein n=1 Tax=Arthrobacter sp. GMC3 TaxID=2058894 RepID=UPI000CE2DB00|nr:serine hydrolase domain-containing protein [Arthrobacter sp. GMC3]